MPCEQCMSMHLRVGHNKGQLIFLKRGTKTFINWFIIKILKRGYTPNGKTVISGVNDIKFQCKLENNIKKHE